MNVLKTHKWDLLVELVKTSFKLRYNNSVLGFFWVLLKPLMTFVVLYLVWSRLLDRGGANYQLYLLLGIIIYTFFNESVTMGMNSLLDKAHIILKVNFPRQIAVFASTVMAAVNLLINLLIFFIFALFSTANLTLAGIIYTFFVLVVMYIALLGMSFFTSIFLVYLRDLQSIADVALQLGFWATPIVYTLDNAALGHSGTEQTLRDLIAANPIGIVINTARVALIEGRIENVLVMFGYLLAGLIFCTLGWWFFSREVRTVAESF